MTTPGRTAVDRAQVIFKEHHSNASSNTCDCFSVAVIQLSEYAKAEVEKAKGMEQIKGFDKGHASALTQAAEIARKVAERYAQGPMRGLAVSIAFEIESLQSSPAKEETGEGA